MRRLIVLLIVVNACVGGLAQTTMHIYYRNGMRNDVVVEDIDSITFSDGVRPLEKQGLVASWLWGNREQGYFELLSFSEDYTYTGYDNYFSYGFDTMTYGWWAQIGAMLTLQSNGFGYQRRYNWYIMELTGNALSVMTNMGPFTYYRLQDDILHLRTNGEIVCDDGDSFVFADGVTADIQDNKLVGLAVGVTYVQKCVAANNTILSYKVIVE